MGKTKIPVKMLKTLAPDEVPNGTIGVMLDDPKAPGLKRAVFGEYLAYVYNHEVEE